jgi:hypothetical protein
VLVTVNITNTLFSGEIKAQTGGTTAAGDSYVCVPPGYCDNGGTPTSPGIDPRIVTPVSFAGLLRHYRSILFRQGNSVQQERYLVTRKALRADAVNVSSHQHRQQMVPHRQKLIPGKLSYETPPTLCTREAGYSSTTTTSSQPLTKLLWSKLHQQ